MPRGVASHPVAVIACTVGACVLGQHSHSSVQKTGNLGALSQEIKDGKKDCESVCVSVCLSVSLSLCLYVCMSACLYVFRPSVCLSVFLSVWLSVCLSVFLSIGDVQERKEGSKGRTGLG